MNNVAPSATPTLDRLHIDDAEQVDIWSRVFHVGTDVLREAAKSFGNSAALPARLRQLSGQAASSDALSPPSLGQHRQFP
jgi:hypothetical protein